MVEYNRVDFSWFEEKCKLVFHPSFLSYTSSIAFCSLSFQFFSFFSSVVNGLREPFLILAIRYLCVWSKHRWRRALGWLLGDFFPVHSRLKMFWCSFPKFFCCPCPKLPTNGRPIRHTHRAIGQLILSANGAVCSSMTNNRPRPEMAFCFYLIKTRKLSPSKDGRFLDVSE